MKFFLFLILLFLAFLSSINFINAHEEETIPGVHYIGHMGQMHSGFSHNINNMILIRRNSITLNRMYYPEYNFNNNKYTMVNMMNGRMSGYGMMGGMN